MALTAGTRVGTYEVLGRLGAGGMGEVYRARDTRLGRDVALKVLPDHFASDPERLARFEREAQVLASVNHPHIAAIFGFEESHGIRALVLELVDGETLAQRIARGPIPVGETLLIARQIAEALEAAHEQGIIHRDLKPANITITRAGAVKVLDFGLAKLTAAHVASGAVSTPLSSVTVTRDGMQTAGELILGTPAYMSPEQARGSTVDKRSDIWAFGCVLYEMLVGRRAFDGASGTESIAAVLGAEPDWARLPPDLPSTVRDVLHGALEKDPARRRRDIHDLRLDLERGLSMARDGVRPAPATRAKWPLWTLAVSVVLAIAALGTVLTRPARPAQMRVEILTPPTPDPMSLAFSPDGRAVAFVGAADGRPRLWVRRLDDGRTEALEGTEGASYPFWSPDAGAIGFFAAGKLKRVSLAGGPPQTLADASFGLGGTWNEHGSILFAPNFASGLLRLPSSGGEPMTQTRLDAPGHTTHRFPRFLPGGRSFLFFVPGTADVAGVYQGWIDRPEITRVVTADAGGEFVSPNWVLFVRRGTLLAQPFDLDTGEVRGEAIAVAEGVASDSTTSVAAFSVSAHGEIALRRAGGGERQLTWFDRSGRPVGSLGSSDVNSLTDPELSPDGRRAIVSRTVENNTDLWLLDGDRSARFTFEPAVENIGIWSNDGSRIIYRSNRNGAYDLLQKPSSGAGGADVIVQSAETKIANDWSRDGRFLLYQSRDSATGNYDLWVLPLRGGGKPFIFQATPFDERYGQFSPDGNWVAYQSNELGRFEIYVRSFGGSGGQWQISTAGGIWPRWRHDGRELYYVAPDGRLMAASIGTPRGTLDAGAATPLFHTRVVGGGTSGVRQQYDVAPDGRFLVNVAASGESAPAITLLLNWNKPKT